MMNAAKVTSITSVSALMVMMEESGSHDSVKILAIIPQAVPESGMRKNIHASVTPMNTITRYMPHLSLNPQKCSARYISP